MLLSTAALALNVQGLEVKKRCGDDLGFYAGVYSRNKGSGWRACWVEGTFGVRNGGWAGATSSLSLMRIQQSADPHAAWGASHLHNTGLNCTVTHRSTALVKGARKSCFRRCYLLNTRQDGLLKETLNEASPRIKRRASKSHNLLHRQTDDGVQKRAPK